MTALSQALFHLLPTYSVYFSPTALQQADAVKKETSHHVTINEAFSLSYQASERGVLHRRAEHVANSCKNSTQPHPATHYLTYHGTVNLTDTQGMFRNK
ncbi:hypothetical protein H8F46_01710 [Xenorhabdus nematophila]|uniref:hypothetical protein n=1 Tax=Xenorhabdus nematophila TaxID=628 RepID=UPI001269B40B|nr:hypothetical protein [Xenorhabdus nematophila]MCB4426688.1 hypothetical protein [Xenorhabdus nematophila]QNJ37016.1 hypothetical protein H8F46_01710 [Xenorhabdus nematophila]